MAVPCDLAAVSRNVIAPHDAITAMLNGTGADLILCCGSGGGDAFGAYWAPRTAIRTCDVVYRNAIRAEIVYLAIWLF